MIGRSETVYTSHGKYVARLATFECDANSRIFHIGAVEQKANTFPWSRYAMPILCVCRPSLYDAVPHRV